MQTQREGADYRVGLPRGKTKSRSGNNVGKQLVFDEGNAVAQVQFALFQPLDLQDIGARRILQGCDRGVEVAMLLLQARKLRPELTFFLFGHAHRFGTRGLVNAPRRPKSQQL